jgi:ketosteroid isomerase-like protein
MPERRDALSLVREMYEAAREHGPRIVLDRYEDWFSQDFEWNPILLTSVDGRTYRGKAEFRNYWDQFLDAFSEVELGEGSIEAVEGDQVLITAGLRVKGAGSGVPIDRTVAYLFEVRDGLVTSGRTFFSPSDAREFLAHA